jgi:amino acid transporter
VQKQNWGGCLAGYFDLVFYAAVGLAIFIDNNYHSRTAALINDAIGIFLLVYLCTMICALFYAVASKSPPSFKNQNRPLPKKASAPGQSNGQ